CSTPRLWGIPFLLAVLPFVVRLVQSIRRWFDSRLYTHLINGGKYGVGIVYYFFYYLWRHNGSARDGSFVLFCLFGAMYSSYACSWDLLMDWSVLQVHSRYPLLRPHVLYTSYIPMYYPAIIINMLLRFSWVVYVPKEGPANLLRTWIVAMLEVIRRWQWNFYRLENEHLGNMDQYRITHEIPMYYSRDVILEVDEEDDGDDAADT
ncbi:EXS family-domain-containing protein, partial [Vararia minispora EC-137]